MEEINEIYDNITIHDELREYIALDIEATGLNKLSDKIIEIGAIKIKDGKKVGEFSELINPGKSIPKNIIELTGITDEMVEGCREEKEVLIDFYNFIEGLPLVAHNAGFDVPFLEVRYEKMGLKLENRVVDTLKIARGIMSNISSHDLGTLCYYLGIDNKEHHRAINDVEVMIKVLNVLLESCIRRGVTLEEILKKK